MRFRVLESMYTSTKVTSRGIQPDIYTHIDIDFGISYLSILYIYIPQGDMGVDPDDSYRLLSDDEMGFSMARGERREQVAKLIRQYHHLTLERRERRLRRGIAVCDLIIAMICITAVFLVCLFIWAYTRS